MKPSLRARDIDADSNIEIGHHGYSARVTLDDDSHGNDAPWDNEDGHGPVSDWRKSRDYSGRIKKSPGEMVLIEDHGRARFYDFAEAVTIARRDGWGYAGMNDAETKGSRAHAAALADFARLRAYCTGEWSYVAVLVTVFRDGEKIGDDALGGIESDGDYWKDQAREMIMSIVSADIRARLDDSRAVIRENREVEYWHARDVMTAA